MFSQCSVMEPDSSRLADILIRSPVWARLALTAANPGLVERAAETMADYIVDKLGEPAPPVSDARQLTLPIL